MEISLSKRNETTLAVKFIIFYKDGIAKIKNVPGRRWIPEESIWSLPYTLEVINQLLMTFKDCKFYVEPQLLEECYLLQSYEQVNISDSLSNVSQWDSVLRQSLKDELLLRGYSSKTVKAYLGQVERFSITLKSRICSGIIKQFITTHYICYKKIALIPM